MRIAYKYRLWTNANQERELGIMLETHRRLYNSYLEERKVRYETEGVTVRKVHQSKRFTEERKTNPWYGRLNRHSAMLTVERLDRAFDNFFRRVKLKQKPGYPRFKGRDFFDSVAFEYGNGAKMIADRLRVQYVGEIRIKLHRPHSGKIKTVSIKREADKWYVVLSCDLGDLAIEPSTNPPIGIDVGLSKFLATSDGETEPNPRYLKDALPDLIKKQRSLSRKKRGGSNRRKARRLVAKAHAKVKNLRREHHHQVAVKLVRRHGLVAAESLDIKSMLGNGRLSRAISDAAWGGFLLTLKSKAERAGVSYVEVEARGTTQECSACGRVVAKTLSDRWHECECGCSLDRDVNAARNILARALQARTEPADVSQANRGLHPRSRRSNAKQLQVAARPGTVS